TLPLIFLSYILVAQPAFTLEDIVLERKFEAKQLRGLSFISDSAYITQETAPDNRSTQVVLHHLDKDEKQILLDTRILATAITGSDFKVNTFQMIDAERFLVARDQESIYRNSKKAYYYY